MPLVTPKMPEVLKIVLRHTQHSILEQYVAVLRIYRPPVSKIRLSLLVVELRQELGVFVQKVVVR